MTNEFKEYRYEKICYPVRSTYELILQLFT